MKKLFAVGMIAVMAGACAFGQTPETKAPPKKKPAGSASHSSDTKLAAPGDKVGNDPLGTPTIQSGAGPAGGKVSINPQPLPPKQQKNVTSVRDKVSLNPQPLPPRQKVGSTSAASKVSLNPQPLPPEPPGDPSAAKKINGPPISPASKVSLNPQPLPPKAQTGPPISPASKVSLNPQPLPPKQAVGGASAGRKVSLNPQPLPPKQATGAAAGQAKQQ